MNNLNWEHIRSFIYVVRTGSLSAAARKLNLSQPTVSRQIQSIEKELRLQLFQRNSKGLTLTSAGQNLVESAQQMDIFSDAFQRKAMGFYNDLQGTIRISACDTIGYFLLPKVIVEFQKIHPKVDIEIFTSNKAVNLFRREADVALSTKQPTQLNLVTRKLSDLALGFYAHQNYIDLHGEPNTKSDIKQYHFIGYDEDLSWIEEAARLGFEFTRHDFVFRTDNLLIQLALARAGGGIVVANTDMVNSWSELKQILTWVPLPPVPLYLVSHQDTQHNHLVRTLTSFLGDWFQNSKLT